MEIFSLVHKGHGHPVYCEDFIFHRNIDENWTVAAVMDGCSSGTDSHFASALLGKILGKSILTLPMLYKIQPELDLNTLLPEALGRFLAENVFNNLKKVSSYLMLDYKETLSTLILLVYHRKSKRAWILVSGDGYVAVNDEITEYYQNNRPDYITYNLNENFDNWFDNHVKIKKAKQVKHIALSTDGIGSFYNPKNGKKEDNGVIEKFLLGDLDSTHSLQNKLTHLEEHKRAIPYDDIGIIRLINNSK